MDYIGLSRILSFRACETRQCVNVTIVDDLVDEPEEVFDVTLERTISLNTRIHLRPVDARVFINDDERKLTQMALIACCKRNTAYCKDI